MSVPALLATLLLTAAPASAAGADPTGVPGDADFAAALYGRVAGGSRGNVCLSPFSVRTALAMTATGAAGPTAAQMAHALRLPPLSPDQVATAFAAATNAVVGRPTDACRVDVANAIWGAAGMSFRPAFVDRLMAGFAASARTVDFAAAPEPARAQINAWVERQTHQKIQGLFPPGSITPATRLVLANAVYLKADWQEPFRAGGTSDAPFHLDGTHAVPVPMMRHDVAGLPVLQGEAVDAVELAYKGGSLAMLVVIPKAIDGLAGVEQGLSADAVQGWVDGLRPTEASVELPKFTATGAYALAGPLAAMGMTDAFDAGRADFSGMVDPSAGGPVCIGGVAHKCVVAVDEKGTEAAAATGITMRSTAMRAGPVVRLVADRPFLYLIRDRRTGTVLFLGRCADPRA